MNLGGGFWLRERLDFEVQIRDMTDAARIMSTYAQQFRAQGDDCSYGKR